MHTIHAVALAVSIMAVNLAALRQALASSLPNVQLGDAIPAAGQEFVNASSYVVMSQ